MNTPSTNTGHPRGLYLLFFTEMWERFSYYGMRAIFILYMTKALLFDKALASNVYGSFTGLVYLTPLLGGYLCDKFWGNRRSILIGGIMMAIGQFFLYLSGSAQLYPKNDSRIDGAFTIFYMGINMGAFFSPLVCGGFSEFKYGFLAAAIGMVVSLISFELLKNKHLRTPDGVAVGMPTREMDMKTMLTWCQAIDISNDLNSTRHF